MAAEFTELMGIFLYLLLALGGGAMVAVFAILLIILVAALSVWVATQVSVRKWSSQLDKEKSLLNGRAKEPSEPPVQIKIRA